jgi:REP element-mobilizing transposase RayT
MTERFRNKYRVPSAKLQNWDYATHAAYFITICTANREHYFGKVSARKRMELSDIGNIAVSEWSKTPELRPDMNLILGNFIVMPDHFHGIIIIGDNGYNNHGGGGDDRGGMDTNTDAMDTERTDAIRGRDAMHGVSTETETGTDTETDTDMDTAAMRTSTGKFGPQRKNLGSIVRGFKSSVTTYARKNDIPFGWQERFYDRIIRDDQEFERISNYIETNPENWKDTNYDLSCE